MHNQNSPEQLGLSRFSPYVQIIRKYADLDPEQVIIDEEEAAILCDVTPRTLENWRKRGSGPRFVKTGRLVKFRLSDVLAFLGDRTFTTTREAKLHTMRGAAE